MAPRKRIPQPNPKQMGLFPAPGTKPRDYLRTRKKNMDVEIPADKRVHQSTLNVGNVNLGRVEYFLEEKSTVHKPNIKIQFILPTEKGKRFGTRLLAQFLFAAKAKNIHHVVADVGEDNIASQRLFQRMGFSLKRVPLGGREREEGAGRYMYRYTLDLEHVGMEGIARRLADGLRIQQLSNRRPTTEQ